MENVIDRKEYRRNNEESQICNDERIEELKNKIKRFLFQSLGASMILLIISFLKFYNCTEILSEIDNALNTKITLTSLEKSGQIIYNAATKYYTKLNIAIEDIMAKQGVKENIKEVKSYEPEIVENAEIISEIVNEIEYESAVEGVNQLSEDANYINQNYSMKIPVIGTITSEFGARNSNNPKVSSYHSGLDIAANTGTQILAALEGEVIEADNDTYFGKYLKIQKDDITMLYAHCSKLLVKAGDIVKKGELIAYVGNTGNSTGSHLHLEIRYKDRLVNPTDVIVIE